MRPSLVIIAATKDGHKTATALIEGAVAKDWNYLLILHPSIGDTMIHPPLDKPLFGDAAFNYAIQQTANPQFAHIACDGKSADALLKLKNENPKLTCAGVITLPGSSILGLLDTTYDALLEYRWTIAAGHDPQEGGRSLIVTNERGVQPVANFAHFASRFLDILASRIGQKHYVTELHHVSKFPEAIERSIAEMIDQTRNWSRLALFPNYQSQDERLPGAEFGFVARRTPFGTLITARGSNKTNPAQDDFVLVQMMPHSKRLKVTSTGGRKASLNAPLAHAILHACPDVEWIVHSHIFSPLGDESPILTTPGTEHDFSAIEDMARSDIGVINQPIHGALFLLEDPEDLYTQLESSQIYRSNPQFYDLAYARFQGTPENPTHFDRIVGLGTVALPRSAAVLDLCCGTGIFTQQLLSLGFTNVEFADGSSEMLAIAEERTGRPGRLLNLVDLKDLKSKKFDLITLRQAFNYIPPELLKTTLSALRKALKPEGRLIFNTFAPLPDGNGPDRDNDFETSTMLVQTHEKNTVAENKVVHAQRSEIIDFAAESWNVVHDLNVFYQHRTDDLKKLLKDLKFEIRVYEQGASRVFVCTRGA